MAQSAPSARRDDPIDAALRLYFQHGARAMAFAEAELERARARGSADEAEWRAILIAMTQGSGDDPREKMLAGWRRLALHQVALR
jgi:hypothetical protein